MMCEENISNDPQPERVDPALLEYPDRIADTFTDKTVLITGGTGLVGKVLIDKLLRCCRGVKKIYLLIRSKGGKSSQERVERLFENPLYGLLKSDKTNDFLPKVVAINGDIAVEDLGISVEDRKLLVEEVDIVYHSAASVRFDEPLKKITKLNVRGTKCMLDLAHGMKQLKLFVHVSTAYAHIHEEILKEKMYPPPADPESILKLLDVCDDNMFSAIESKIMGSYPNTYSFTKALAEGLVNKEIEAGILPVIICRPSVVIPIYKHPLPGWVDNLNGPMGLLIAAGKGMLRTGYMPNDTFSDFIAIDVLINILCILSHLYISDPSCRQELSVTNATTSSKIKITWREIIDMGRRFAANEMPFNWIPWYPGGYITCSYPLHVINFFFKQLIPAMIGDAVLYCLRIKPVALRIQKRIYKSYQLINYYTNNQWYFVSDKIDRFRHEYLNPREAMMYPFIDENLDMDSYIINAMLGNRRYLLNEPDETLPTARRHLKVMYVVDKLFHLFLYYFIYCILCKLYFLFL